MKISKSIFIILQIVLFIILLTGAIFITIRITRHVTLKEAGKEVGLVFKNDFDLSIIERPEYNIEDFNNPFKSFLNDDEMAKVIINYCECFDVNPITVVSILEKENPNLDCKATSSPNDNGTRDLGLFQLNDRSLFEDGGFIDMWWPKEAGEFNPDNWKHNTYIAIKHIQDLQNTFGKDNIYYIAAAYNAGTKRAFNEWHDIENAAKLPSVTRDYYAPSVVNNFNKWQAISNLR